MSALNAYLRWLRGEVGQQERPRGSNRTPYAVTAGHANGYPWCATLLVAGARRVGVQLPAGADTASTYLNEIAFKNAGRLSSKPRVGSIFFVYFPSMQRVAHTGIVWRVEGGRVFTIEGNTNRDGSREGYEVALKIRPASRAPGTVGIRSYGMPYYEEDLMQEKDFDRIERIVQGAARTAAREAVRDAGPTADEVADAMLRKLGNQPVVPNLALRKGDPNVGSNRTVVANLAETDRKLDIILSRLPVADNTPVKPQ